MRASLRSRTIPANDNAHPPSLPPIVSPVTNPTLSHIIGDNTRRTTPPSLNTTERATRAAKRRAVGTTRMRPACHSPNGGQAAPPHVSSTSAPNSPHQSACPSSSVATSPPPLPTRSKFVGQPATGLPTLPCSLPGGQRERRSGPSPNATRNPLTGIATNLQKNERNYNYNCTNAAKSPCYQRRPPPSPPRLCTPTWNATTSTSVTMTNS